MSRFGERRFPIFASFVLLAVAACRTDSARIAPETTANETIVSATPPFETKEPARYRATRTITIINADGQTVITRNRIAKDGQLRRDEPDAASPRVVYLQLPEAAFLVLPDEKLFAEIERDVDGEDAAFETSPDRLLHVEPISTRYQKLGAEVVSGRNTDKYRIVVNHSEGANVSVDETLMWIDESLRLPVKSETTSPGGERTIIELTDITLNVDKDLFKIPGDYEKIPFREARKRLSRSQP